MKIVLQKVTEGCVTVDKEVIGAIDAGYVLLIGIEKGDTESQADWLVQKIMNLRLYTSDDGKINDQSIVDVAGELLIVSQFTIAGTVQKGNRPDYSAAEYPDAAMLLYTYFVQKIKDESGLKVETGLFGATMQVELVNDGPVTLLLER